MQSNRTNIKQAFATFGQKMSEFIRRDKTKSTGRKVASSLWALGFGIFIALLYMVLNSGISKNIALNPFDIFKVIFESFKESRKEYIINFFLIFGFSSFACAISFKAGLFNIGIPGQMMATGFTSFALFIHWGHNNTNQVTPSHLVIALIASVALAALLGIIAGVLKAYLNVHEVITTIMLNWIVVGISMALFQLSSAPLFWKGLDPKQIAYYFSVENEGVTPGAITISQNVKNIFSIIGLVSLIGLVIIGAFIFSFTSLGYKIKMLGISKTNGKYMGVNDKLLTIIILGASGGISGIAGFFYYVVAPSPLYGSITQPLAIGFESIAISLLALNSPVGILFTSLFYTGIYNARQPLQFAPTFVKQEDIQVITSLILYLAATSLMFLNFKPARYFTLLAFLQRDYRTRANKKLFRLQLKRHRLIRSYELKVHKLKLNVSKVNLVEFEQKLNEIELKHQRQMLKNNVLSQRAHTLILHANQVHELQIQLHQAKLNYITQKHIYQDKQKQLQRNVLALQNSTHKINQQNAFWKLQTRLNDAKLAKLAQKCAQIQTQIKELKNTHSDEISTWTSFKAALSSLQTDRLSLQADTISKAQKIKNLQLELKKITNQFLSKAMNYKNSDQETIEYFESINAQKYQILNEMKELGSDAKFKIKQQYTASVKNTKNSFKELFNSFIKEQITMFKECYRAKLNTSKMEVK
ncbi:sugar ABC transporter permease [Mycoplasmopsis mucosicanis]|uniref:Sugar ABC transporter permease n=1 Tax=Mycoplasmopsis mucosicanis TaxID=458208 RepID=A0A507SR19_9BACT|nr:sugar ABC transporter permease [Mycoplasmopsis mucosicanis]TQC54229.1 sugar ABC transporter permease [Mycoplasmopsis mucosicanis]